MMLPLTQTANPAQGSYDACSSVARSRRVFWLQTVTIGWMVVECGLSLYAAAAGRSSALLAFGSDSLVELLSASVVFLNYFWPRFLSQRAAGRIAAGLLVALAAGVGVTSTLALVLRSRPQASCLGIGITVAALVVMPVLAYGKRKEAERSGNVALAADAVQSATCAYLAVITLLGLAVNAAFHAPWVDSCAALIAIPILLKEARSAWQGQSCCCQGALTPAALHQKS